MVVGTLRTEHLKRYREIAGLLWKYGRSDLAKLPGLDGNLGDEPQAGPGEPQGEELAEFDVGGPKVFERFGEGLRALFDLRLDFPFRLIGGKNLTLIEGYVEILPPILREEDEQVAVCGEVAGSQHSSAESARWMTVGR